MAERYPDQSRLSAIAEVAVLGQVQKVVVSFGNINPQLSNKDAVDVGNALGSLCRYSPDYIRRNDTFEFSPDEFDGV